MVLFKDKFCEPNHDYDGVLFGFYALKKDQSQNVTLTVSETINRNINTVNVYVNGVRKTGVRYNKDRIGLFEMDILLNSIYWEYMCQNIE